MTYEPPPDYPQYDPPPTYSEGPYYPSHPPQPYIPQYAAAPATHQAPRKSRKGPGVILGVLVILGIGAVVYGLTSGSKGGSGGDPSKVIATNTIAVTGQMELVDTSGYSSITTDGSGGCDGSGPYNDISAGGEVVISDDTGKTLAITSLDSGTGDSSRCDFAWSATVPSGKGFYGVTVSHRGTVKFSEAQMRQGPGTTMGS